MTASASLAADLKLGPVELSVTSLERSLAFYTGALGLTLLEREGPLARLGVPGRTLLELREVPGARPAPTRSPGLYHFALLLPSRADLGRFVRHFAGLGLPLGQGDHLVSEAFYTQDPDGHGIEVYRDRPRREWRWEGGQVQMATDPVDVASLLAEPGAQAPFTGLPEGTHMGHVHLKVNDLAAARAFYLDLLGFDAVSALGGQALFVSVGGYHHHLGLNTWHSAGGAPAPQDSARLLGVGLELPQAQDLNALQERLRVAGYPHSLQDGVLSVLDPAGNPLHFTAG